MGRWVSGTPSPWTGTPRCPGRSGGGRAVRRGPGGRGGTGLGRARVGPAPQEEVRMTPGGGPTWQLGGVGGRAWAESPMATKRHGARAGRRAPHPPLPAQATGTPRCPWVPPGRRRSHAEPLAAPRQGLLTSPLPPPGARGRRGEGRDGAPVWADEPPAPAHADRGPSLPALGGHRAVPAPPGSPVSGERGSRRQAAGPRGGSWSWEAASPQRGQRRAPGPGRLEFAQRKTSGRATARAQAPAALLLPAPAGQRSGWRGGGAAGGGSPPALFLWSRPPAACAALSGRDRVTMGPLPTAAHHQRAPPAPQGGQAGDSGHGALAAAVTVGAAAEGQQDLQVPPV